MNHTRILKKKYSVPIKISRKKYAVIQPSGDWANQYGQENTPWKFDADYIGTGHEHMEHIAGND